MLNHDFMTNVVCVDPCVLDRGHYAGALDQRETLMQNLHADNPYGRHIEVHELFSNDQGLLQKLKHGSTKIDILFIDGDIVLRECSTTGMISKTS